MSFVLPMVLGMAGGAAIGAVNSPMQLFLNKAMPILPQNPNQLVTNLFRGNIERGEYLNEMEANGFNQKNADQIALGQETLLGARDILNLFRRGKLGNTPTENREAYFQRMQQLGFNGIVANQFITSQEVIESPQQIILFLVREVLNPKLREELELDKEYPEDATKEFLKLGISEDLARRVWASHWELPDVSTMQTVLHRYSEGNEKYWKEEIEKQGLDPQRVKTNTNEISQLLKFKDVSPKYREQVLSTLFNDVGQIQLRWLIRFRFIDFNEAVYRHERQGLPKTIAEQVTKVVFVVQSITDWKTAISKGAMTFDDVLIELQEWNITEENIIRIVKLKVADDIAEGVADERELTKTLIRDSWQLGQISRSEVLEELMNIGYSDEQTKFIFEVWEAEEEIKKVKESLRGGLTTAETKKAFRLGKITKEEAVQQLIDNGKQKQAAELIIQIEEDALA